MEKLFNIKNFDEYFNELNEALYDDDNYSFNDVFLHYSDDKPTIDANGKTIPAKPIIRFNDGGSVTPQEIVDVVQRAIGYLRTQYKRTFYFANKTMNIVYLPHSKKYQTMSVNKNMVMYLNAGFVYNTLNMDYRLIAAVIMHEVFHVIYNHIERGENWLSAKGKQITKSTWNDTNLAADVEVNQTLVKVHMITESELVNNIRGIYLSNKNGSNDILTMEMILNDEELMDKLRALHPVDPDPEKKEGPVIKTSDDFDSGFIDGWNSIAEIVKKYGYKKTSEQLMSTGVINQEWEILIDDVDKINDKIKQIKDNLEVFTPETMNFLQIKGFDEFINENNNQEPGQTYDEGFNTGFSKVIGVVKTAINGNEGGGGPIPPGAPKFDNNIDKSKLIELELPDNDDDNDDNDDNDDTDDNLPNPVKQKQVNKSKDKIKDKENNKDNDNQNNGDDDIEKDIKSAGKLIDDLKKKYGDEGKQSQSGENQKSDDNTITDDTSGKEKQSQSGGNEEKMSNGGFLTDDDDLNDDDLKDSGYSQEDIDRLNELRKANKEKNTPERIKKVINDYRNQVSNNFIEKLIGKIDVESNKYRNIWESILKNFFNTRTRRAGKDLNTGHNDWKNKRKIALGSYGHHRLSQAQDPQDVNIYVDVSGSMDMELLEIIAKSLVIYSEQYEYSGINICPWASDNIGVIKINSLYEKNKSSVVTDILSAISLGKNKCGGGTEVKAMISAILDAVEYNLKDSNKIKKDDIHIIITDGYINGYESVESKIKTALKGTFKNSVIANKAVKNTVWMLYDTDENLQKDWNNEIKEGKIIFINSDSVKNNKKV